MSQSLKALPPLHESCPWCGQGIPHEQLDEIHERIKANERAQSRAIERRLTNDLTERLAAADAQHATELAAANNAAIAAVAAAKQAAEDEASAAIVAAEADFAQRQAAAVNAADAARVAAEDALAVVTAGHEQSMRAQLAEQREALEQHQLKLINEEKARAFAERQKLEEELAKMQRKLQKKSADELGEGAEVDLFENLRKAFPGDEIQRVKRGEPGADIVHKIVEDGRTCGQIVYDSKNRTAWRNDYVTKLRSDQLAAEADHAILASAVFPAGSKQLHIQDAVVVANPARVIALVSILRKHQVHLATLRLSEEARSEKMAELYDFVTSERYGQLVAQADTLAENLLELDVKEKRAHDSTWKKRGELIRAIERNNGTLAAEIDGIVTAAAAPLDGTT